MRGKRQPFVFPTDSEIVRNRTQNTRNPDTDASRKYQEYKRNYINGDFTYECQQFIRNICDSAKSDKALVDFPLRDILIAVSKKLFLNELEFLFLSCLIDTIKWPIFDQTIKNHANTLKTLTVGLPETFQNKCAELYTLLAAYSVKVYLNEDIKIFQEEMNNLLPKFSQIFQTWGNKFARSALGINPKKLNVKYMNFAYKNSEHTVHHQDLNSKVDELLENAPPALELTKVQKLPKDQIEVIQSVQQPVHQEPKNEEEDELLPPPPIMRQQSSKHSQFDFPSIPWPMTGDSFYGGSIFARQNTNTFDFTVFTQNGPALYRMESANSEYNIPSLMLKSQHSIDKQPPAT